jgi:Protein of unknown function (DUF3570)
VVAVAVNRRQRRAQAAIERRNQRKKNRYMAPLVSAFLSISSLSSDLWADTNSSLPEPEMRVRYMHYTEHQSDGTERMTIKAPMALIRTKPADDLSVEGIFTYDGISGASPNYLDSVSGASGKGIEDKRYEGQLRAAKQFGGSIVGSTLFFSDEDDYKALSGGLDVTHSIEGTDTQVSFSVSHSADEVSSSRDDTIDEHRDSSSVSIGVGQIIDENSLFSTSLGYTYRHGYLTDPYKTFDIRPEQRNEFVLSNRYIRYIEATDGSLHVDLRGFSDDWGITSQTLELTFYQPFCTSWMLRPNIRYYSQHQATFFNDIVPPTEFDGSPFSADQRLGTFGSLTFGLRLEHYINDTLTIDLSANHMEQRTEWSLVGGDGSKFQALHAIFYGVGVYKKF